MDPTLFQAILDHFAAALAGCEQPPLNGVQCACEPALIVTHGKARGIGDEVCVWLERVETERRDRAPVVRRYHFGVQCLRTGYPTIGAELDPKDDLPVSPEAIANVMPFFNSIGSGLLAGFRDFGKAFRCDPTLTSMLAQGPTGSQAGWALRFSTLNPRTPQS